MNIRKNNRRRQAVSAPSALLNTESLETRQVLSALSPIGKLGATVTPRPISSEALSPIGQLGTVVTPRPINSEALSPIGLTTSRLGDTEPNNSAVNANEIGLTAVSGITGITHSGLTTGHVGIGTDTADWYKVTVDGDTDAVFSLYNLLGDLDIQVQDSSGRLLGQSLQGGRTSDVVSLSGLEPGTYYIRVFKGSNSASSSYSLGIRAKITEPESEDPTEPNNSSNNAFDLGIPTTDSPIQLTGDVGGADEADWFAFTLEEDSGIRIGMTGLSADIDIELRRPDGTVIASSLHASDRDELIELSALEAGDYLIFIRPYGTAVSSYELSVQVTSGLSVPATPIANGPSGSITTGRPSFSWTAVTGADDYQIQIRNTATGTVATYTTTSTQFTLPQGLANGTYTWTIVARNGAGSSTPSAAVTFAVRVVVPRIPGNVTGPRGNVAQQAPSFSWPAVPGAESYEVRIMRGNTVVGVMTSSGTQLTWNSSLGAGSYSWQIRALNSAGASAWTTAVSFTVMPNRSRRDISLKSNIVVSIQQNIPGNSEDWYRFSITSRRNVDIQLARLSADFDIELYSGSTTQSTRIAFSANSGTGNERIRTTSLLAAGTYYLRVVPKAIVGSSSYNITFNCSGRIAS